jgi:hypothetical protein
MIASQSPTLQVFLPVEPVSRADVPSQRFSSVAAVQANHIVPLHGSPHRYSRDKNFFERNGLSKLTERLMHGGDEIRNLICSHPMVPHVTPDDRRC